MLATEIHTLKDRILCGNGIIATIFFD